VSRPHHLIPPDRERFLVALGQHLRAPEVRDRVAVVRVFEQVGGLEMAVTPAQLSAFEDRSHAVHDRFEPR